MNSLKIKTNMCSVLVFIMVFFASLSIISQVDLFADDYTYKQVAVCSFDRIVEFIKWHINNYNGRTLIHIMDMLFLRYEWGLTVWKLLISGSVSLLISFVAKIVIRKNEDYNEALILAAMCFFIVNPRIYSRAIYWVSGSFNYFVPVFLLLIVFLINRRNAESKWLIPMAFIAGATMEQTGMMAIGYFVLLTAERFIRTRKISKRYIQCLICAVLGYATVLLSPGTFKRTSTQTDGGVIRLFKNLIIILQEHWFGNINMQIFIVGTIICLSLWILKLRKTDSFFKKTGVFLVVLLWLLTFCNFSIKFFLMVFEKWDFLKHYEHVANVLFFIVFAIYASVYFLISFLTVHQIYVHEKEYLPVFTFVLGFGSMFMMCISNSYHDRNSFPLLMMTIVFIVGSLIRFKKEINKTDVVKRKDICKKAIVFVLLLAICFAHVTAYPANKPESIANISSLKGKESELQPLSKAEMEEFIKSIESDYYEYYSAPDSFWNIEKDIFDFEMYLHFNQF